MKIINNNIDLENIIQLSNNCVNTKHIRIDIPARKKNILFNNIFQNYPMPPLFFYSSNNFEFSILDGMKRILILLADNTDVFFDIEHYKIVIKEPSHAFSMRDMQYNNLDYLSNSELLLAMELRQRFFTYMFNVYFIFDCSYQEAKNVLHNYHMSCYETD